MKPAKTYPDKPDTVYFFGTCLIDLIYPQAGLAGIQLIQREGVRVIFPQDQSCCGQPAWNSGYRDQARSVALTQIRSFPKDIPIVVPSASCAGMMKNQYPELFRDHPDSEQAERFAHRVYELTEFLVHVLKIRLQDLGPPTTVALHASCSAQREMAVADEHASLLQQLDNVEILEQERKTECCGFGGTFAVKHPEISAAMVEDKSRAIAKTGAVELVSGDCGCLMNITGHIQHTGIGPEGRHIASFLWERTNAAES
jgi:L-lactate dehydrogenase complex protein LldE